MDYKKFYNIIGVSFLTILIVRLYIAVTTNNFSFTELLSWTALAYLSFSAGHLYPLLKENNERAKRIKEKGMKISLYIVLFLFLLISLANLTDVIHLDMVEIFSLLISITIISIFSSWNILSKKH